MISSASASFSVGVAVRYLANQRKKATIGWHQLIYRVNSICTCSHANRAFVCMEFIAEQLRSQLSTSPHESVPSTRIRKGSASTEVVKNRCACEYQELASHLSQKQPCPTAHSIKEGSSCCHQFAMRVRRRFGHKRNQTKSMCVTRGVWHSDIAHST